MIIVKILLVLFLLFAWVLTMWISYLAGMAKGFQDFIKKNSKEWNFVDKLLYDSISKKENQDNINPITQIIAQKKINELKHKNEMDKIKKSREKIIKGIIKDEGSAGKHPKINKKNGKKRK